ncbi:MAG: carboxymuconolactone decarboxylase family protein [Bacteroidota bacterium]
MLTRLTLPDSITTMRSFKKLFTVREMYLAFVRIPYSLFVLFRHRKNKQIDEQFIERLQLAVTQVNGCAACSYAHTYLALKKGLDKEEIDDLLTAEDHFSEPSQVKAVLFARHFADQKGFPQRDAFESIEETYGKKQAGIILAAIQIMQAANIYGLSFSALYARFKGRPYHNSTLLYEAGMQLAGILMFPFAMLHGLIYVVPGVSWKRFA